MDFKHHDIKKLLERFHAAETSIEEELLLHEFFATHPAPEGMEEDAVYFSALASGASMELDNTFDSQLMSRIRNRENWVMIFRWSMRIAASVIFVIGLATIGNWIFSNASQPAHITQTVVNNVTDDEVIKAFEQTKSALLLISSKLNKGQEQTMRLSKFDEAQMQIAGGTQQ